MKRLLLTAVAMVGFAGAAQAEAPEAVFARNMAYATYGFKCNIIQRTTMLGTMRQLEQEAMDAGVTEAALVDAVGRAKAVEPDCSHAEALVMKLIEHLKTLPYKTFTPPT